MRRRRGLGGVSDSELQRSARNSINLARGAMIRAGTRARSCERQFTQLVKATAELKAASVAIQMMDTSSTARFALQREHARALKTARTTMTRFKDRCFV